MTSGSYVITMQHDDPKAGSQDKCKTGGDREARLAEALRANLRKRKAQARARRKSEDPSGGSRPDQD